MRGKAEMQKHERNCKRITPACAGKRTIQQFLPSACWDHPRVCGEKCGNFDRDGLVTGSPPRVRGKVQGRYKNDVNFRITPACAGKSMHTLLTSAAVRDHPRVCGEKEAVGQHQCRIGGSPPRVRGKVISTIVFNGIPGITPACAGKSLRRLLEPHLHEDHPRVCGEKCHTSIPLCGD